MMVLSWHSIRVDSRESISTRRSMSLKPTYIFLNRPSSKSRPRLSRLLKDRKCLSDATYLYPYWAVLRFRKEKVMHVKSVSLGRGRD